MYELKDIAYAIKLSIDIIKYEKYPRPYLGMSQIGHSCARNLWMYFRWASKIKHNARSQRIFDRGHIEEERVLDYWEKIGIKIIERQQTLSACGGHLKGHTDGRLTNIPGMEKEIVVGEVKSMAHKYFVPLVKKGIKASKPAYYGQAQVYMHYDNLKYCLHSTTNKNDEELYIEVLKYEPQIAEPMAARAEDIIFSNFPPKKISTDPTYFECRWCDFYGPCQLDDPFEKTCRTCCNVEVVNNGTWECLKHEKVLTLDEQKAACPNYNVLKV